MIETDLLQSYFTSSLPGFRLLAFAVSTILYIMALDFAPATISIITQFFLPMQNPRKIQKKFYPELFSDIELCKFGAKHRKPHKIQYPYQSLGASVPKTSELI